MEDKARTVAAKIWYTVESEKPNLTTIESTVEKAKKGSVTIMRIWISQGRRKYRKFGGQRQIRDWSYGHKG